MCRYKKVQTVRRIVLEGNNGGDFIELEETDEEGIVLIRAGHCCVMTFPYPDTRIPVEFITTLLANILFYPEQTKEMMKQLWPGDFGGLLADKIEYLTAVKD
jgi:hypothetical protein